MHKCINLIRRGCVISPKDLPRRPPSFIVFMCKKSIYMPTTTLESICFLICGVRWNFADNYPDRAASCRNYHKITLHRILDFCVLDNVSIGSKESKVCSEWAQPAGCPVIHWREIYYGLEVKPQRRQENWIWINVDSNFRKRLTHLRCVRQAILTRLMEWADFIMMVIYQPNRFLILWKFFAAFSGWIMRFI